MNTITFLHQNFHKKEIEKKSQNNYVLESVRKEIVQETNFLCPFTQNSHKSCEELVAVYHLERMVDNKLTSTQNHGKESR
jgi:hypothetical protein